MSSCRKEPGRWSPKARPRLPARLFWPISASPTTGAATGRTNGLHLARFVAMAECRGPCYMQIMPFEPSQAELRRRRFRPIPVRMLVPNVITLLAICAGLTAIRLSAEGRMDVAVAAIVFAAVLDGIDGRIARLIK